MKPGVVQLLVSFVTVLVEIPGKENSATRRFAFDVAQLEYPVWQGSTSLSIAWMALVAQPNSVIPEPQLGSALFIDPVESRTMATFQGSAWLPSIDAVAVADTDSVGNPTRNPKNVLTVPVSVTRTAFGVEVVLHVVPEGSSMFRQTIWTVGVPVL
jgi:hypothetical protein